MHFEMAAPGAILLFDGVFLLRAELLGYWDLTIFVDAPFNITVRRMSHRDGTSSPDPDAAENRRYVYGQRLYLQHCDPKSAATIVVNNSDLASPGIFLRNRPG
jgi:uridine kinase